MDSGLLREAIVSVMDARRKTYQTQPDNVTMTFHNTKRP